MPKPTTPAKFKVGDFVRMRASSHNNVLKHRTQQQLWTEVLTVGQVFASQGQWMYKMTLPDGSLGHDSVYEWQLVEVKPTDVV